MHNRLPTEQDYKQTDAILAMLPGAEQLIALCGGVPGFHDGEVVSLTLAAKGASTIAIKIFGHDPRGLGDVVVNFQLAEILDVKLGDFSPQNVIYGLLLRPADIAAERQAYLWRSVCADDFEIELEPSYGISGSITGRGLSISAFRAPKDL